MNVLEEKYDVAVVGAGHAGCEAALACARLGLDTIMFTVSVDSIALMPCNPNIGGSSKGHLVREIDALGGEMGKNIDKTFIQSKMLNVSKGPAVHSLRAQADKQAYTREMEIDALGGEMGKNIDKTFIQSKMLNVSKGPAVHSLRAQADKQAYTREMRNTLENTEHLTIRQAEVTEILAEEGKVTGVKTYSGAIYHAKAVVLCTGTYLKARCADKQAYTREMRNTLENTEHLTIRQAEVTEILAEEGKVTGVKTYSGAIYHAKAVVLCTGTYLTARCIYGDISNYTGPNGLQAANYLTDSLKNLGIEIYRFKTGTPARIDKRSVDFSKMEEQFGDERVVPFPNGLQAANYLTESLKNLGIEIYRFKTGTPARIDKRSVDFSKMEEQFGDERVVPFSFSTNPEDVQIDQASCWLTYTNEKTHEIIRANLDRSPLYSGMIEGTGPRYCPSQDIVLLLRIKWLNLRIKTDIRYLSNRKDYIQMRCM